MKKKEKRKVGKKRKVILEKEKKKKVGKKIKNCKKERKKIDKYNFEK
jgi:hypothetical protein